MAKYHVGINGKPATCTAQTWKMPKGFKKILNFSILESASIRI